MVNAVVALITSKLKQFTFSLTGFNIDALTEFISSSNGDTLFTNMVTDEGYQLLAEQIVRSQARPVLKHKVTDVPTTVLSSLN